MVAFDVFGGRRTSLPHSGFWHAPRSAQIAAAHFPRPAELIRVLVGDGVGQSIDWGKLGLAMGLPIGSTVDGPLFQNRKMQKVVTRGVQQVAINSAIS
jgi:hypothetical protein